MTKCYIERHRGQGRRIQSPSVPSVLDVRPQSQLCIITLSPASVLRHTLTPYGKRRLQRIAGESTATAWTVYESRLNFANANVTDINKRRGFQQGQSPQTKEGQSTTCVASSLSALRRNSTLLTQLSSSISAMRDSLEGV